MEDHILKVKVILYVIEILSELVSGIKFKIYIKTKLTINFKNFNILFRCNIQQNFTAMEGNS